MGDAPTVAAISPKLLELNKEDVNAVRSFLPGRILGRTAALLALGVLCLRFHELFNVGIGQFIGFQLEPRWLKNWTCPAFVESVFDFMLPALRTEAG